MDPRNTRTECRQLMVDYRDKEAGSCTSLHLINQRISIPPRTSSLCATTGATTGAPTKEAPPFEWHGFHMHVTNTTRQRPTSFPDHEHLPFRAVPATSKWPRDIEPPLGPELFTDGSHSFGRVNYSVSRTFGADPPRPPKAGYEWVWFPEGYWAERRVPDRVPKRSTFWK